MQTKFGINITSFEEQLIGLKSQQSSLGGKIALLGEQKQQGEANLEDLRAKKELYAKEIELLTLLQETTKQQIKKGFESIISYALQFVFKKDYKFELIFDRRGNIPEIRFGLLSPDRKELSEDILNENGGGIGDILQLALRIALMELSKPKVEGMLCLDESIKNIHNNVYIENTAKFLKEMSVKLNRQIILITGVEEKEVFENNADNIINLDNYQGEN